MGRKSNAGGEHVHGHWPQPDGFYRCLFANGKTELGLKSRRLEGEMLHAVLLGNPLFLGLCAAIA